MNRLLVINADDLGWSLDVNAGIIEAHRQGVLTSATLMAGMPASDDALRLLKDCPALGVGIHLSLTAGVPVCPEEWVRATLAPAGSFNPSTPRLLLHARTSRRWREAAELELAAQIDWAISHGVHPGHLDSHKHIHGVRPIADIVARLAQRFGVKLVRNTRESLSLNVGRVPALPRLRRRLLNHWSKAANRVYRRAGLIQPDTLFGVEDTGRPDLVRVKAFLDLSQARTVEWMVHPGNHEDSPATPSRLGDARVSEKNMLKSPELRDMISRSGFVLVRYEELLK